MKHYGIEEWVDFARGLSDPAQTGEMREHLAASCSECVPVADFFRKFDETARGMEQVSLPDRVIKAAKAIFPVYKPANARALVRLTAELVYDSFLAPAPAGLRSSWQMGWQRLYRAGDCSLDLRIEPELRSSRTAVIGQISNHTAPEDCMSDVPVCLKSGRLVVAETRSNQFGEFQLEYEQQGRLQLCVFLDGGTKSIQVPLKRFAVERPAGTERLKLKAAPKNPPGRK